MESRGAIEQQGIESYVLRIYLFVVYLFIIVTIEIHSHFSKSSEVDLYVVGK